MANRHTLHLSHLPAFKSWLQAVSYTHLDVYKRQHLRGAEAARKAMEVEKLDSEVFDLTKSLKPEPREALLAKRREIAQLPDDEAAPQLRELLKGKGV